MKINVFENYEELSKEVSEFIIERVNNNKKMLLCFAGGDTPVLAYKNLVKAYEEGRVDFKDCKFVGLDEWVGLDENDLGSCKYLLYKEVFEPLKIKEENICFFDGKAKNLQKECKNMDMFIEKYGPIDLIVLGIGVNGHLGFNEPGVSFENYTHVVNLQDSTKVVGQKYFEDEKKLEKGITLGIRYILESDTPILIANGKKKSDAIKRLLEDEITENMPASALKLHNNSHIFLDKEATLKINLKK